MLTRSRARVERERSRTIEKLRRTKRKRKLFDRESRVSSYDLRSSMGRKGGNTNKAASSRSEQVGRTAVTPIRLFDVQEENNAMEELGKKVCLICLR